MPVSRQAEIVVISSLSDDYCHIVTPPEIWKVRRRAAADDDDDGDDDAHLSSVWKVPLRNRIYLGHYHEFHYVSTRPMR